METKIYCNCCGENKGHTISPVLSHGVAICRECADASKPLIKSRIKRTFATGNGDIRDHTLMEFEVDFGPAGHYSYGEGTHSQATYLTIECEWVETKEGKDIYRTSSGEKFSWRYIPGDSRHFDRGVMEPWF